MNKRLILLFFCIGCSCAFFGQSRVIDSLKKVLATSAPDTNRALALNALVAEFVGFNPDSAYFFGKQSLNLAKQLNWTYGLASANHNVAMCLRVKSDYSLALDHYLLALKYWEQLEREKPADATSLQKRKLKTIGNIGLIYSETGDFPQAMSYYFQALKISEKIKDKSSIARNFGNIGGVYVRQKNDEKALEYISKSITLFEELGDKLRVAIGLSNLGGICESMGDHEKALDYSLKALKVFEELGEKNNIAFALGNIGSVYKAGGEYEKALENFRQALKLKEEVGDKNGIAIQCSNLGDLYLQLKKYTEAEKFLKRALALDVAIRSLEGQRDRNKMLSDLYKQTNKPQLALDHFKQYILAKDSISSSENIKRQTQLEMLNEFEKKETAQKSEREKMDAVAKAEREKEKQQQRVILFSVSGFLCLVLCFVFFIWRALAQKKRINSLISRQKQEVEMQKQIVEMKQIEILDSIRYARRIQSALMTPEISIRRILSELNKK
jgi:tetratricopeptide (TPR) repeat protein